MIKSHSRELLSQTFTYGIGLMINRFLSFMLIPLYTFYFKPDELGVYNILQSLWMVIAIFFLFGLETSFVKFITDEKEQTGKSRVYSTTIIMLSVTSFVLSTVFFLMSNLLSEILEFSEYHNSAHLYKILAAVLYFDTIYRFPLLLLRAELKARSYLYLNIVSITVNLIFNILFIVVFKMGIESIFYSYIISCIATLFISFFLTKKYLICSFSFNTAKKLLFYGNKFIYVGLFILFIDVSDRFFLKYFTNDATVGIYSANYKLASGMGLIIAAFKFAWTPYFFNLSDNPENKSIVSKVFTNYFFAGLLIFLFFVFFIPPVVTFRSGNLSILNIDYWEGLKIIPYILLSYFFSGLFSNLNVAPFFKNKTSLIFTVTLAGVIINFILNVFLIPEFNMTGAAISTMLTYFLMFIMIYHLSQRIYKIHYEWKKISKIILIFASGFTLSVTLNNLMFEVTLIRLAVNIVIFISVLFITYIAGIFRPGLLFSVVRSEKNVH